jgi:Niemann-Pick C1 protein
VPDQITDPKERLGLALREIGPSIFVAAFCEALAFFIGMRCDIPALTSFCLTAGVAVVADVLFQVLFFLPALYYDRTRIQQNRYDVFCCWSSSNRKPVREDKIRKWYNTYYVPWIFKTSSKVLVILASVALIIIGCLSTTKLVRGLNQNVALVSGSDIYDYFETLYTYGNAGPPGYVVFNNIDYQNTTNLE